MGVNERLKLQDRVETLEVFLAQRPTGIETLEIQFECAWLWSLLGQGDKAQQHYQAILTYDPTNLAVLNNLASLQEKTDMNAAHQTYLTTLQHHPDDPRVHVNLANLLMRNDQLAQARQHFETAVRLDDTCIEAHQGMCLLLQNLGEDEKMQYHRVKGYATMPVTTPMPYVGDTTPIELLLLVSSLGGADVPWRSIVDNRLFHVTSVVAEFYDPTLPLPPHALVFNAIGDADACPSDLQAAEKLLLQTSAPIINPPTAVMGTGRLANADTLRALPGVYTPRIAKIPRHLFADPTVIAGLLAQYGLTFPVLLRSLGFHTGQHFVSVADMHALCAQAAAMPSQALLVMEFLDARGPDGGVRKYRVMMIDGQLYPVHLAISDQWKVHYFSAGMANHPAHQQEEAAFLNDMPGVLGDKGLAALQAIQATLGLDYAGIDFALSPTGDVMVFETNAVMRIVPPAADPQWDYRRPAINAAINAARTMLRRYVLPESP